MPKFIHSVLNHLVAFSLFGAIVFSGESVSAQSASDLLGNEQVQTLRTSKTEVKVTERFSRVVQLDNKITRVDGFDPEIIAVTALSPTQIRIQARTPGVTSMVLVDENQKVYQVEIFVEGDVRHLQAYIQRLFPDSAVTAVKVRDSVVMRGWVSQPDHITEIVEIAEQFYPKVLNQMKLGGVNQVQLRVKVMEVQRSRIRQLGFNWNWLGDNAYAASTPGDIAPLTGLDVPPGGPPSGTVALGAQTIAFGVTSATSIFQGWLEALKQEGLLKILAEPVVVTTSGRPANFLAGGEFPILVPQSLGTVTIQWREFGVRLEAVPIVLGDGNLRLELAPEISERDFSNAVQVNGFTVPGLTTRRVNTQVEMKFGQTLAIGGLIASRETAETSKVPILGELPWVGAAFRRVRYDENETELLITVTPELVAALNKDQMPPGGPGLNTDTPTDMELFFQGLIEVPMHGEYRPAVNGSGATLPPTFHPSYQQMPPVQGQLRINTNRPVERVQPPQPPVADQERATELRLPPAAATSPFPPTEFPNPTAPVEGGQPESGIPAATDSQAGDSAPIEADSSVTWIPETKPSYEALPPASSRTDVNPVNYRKAWRKTETGKPSDSEIPAEWRGLIRPETQKPVNGAAVNAPDPRS